MWFSCIAAVPQRNASSPRELWHWAFKIQLQHKARHEELSPCRSWSSLLGWVLQEPPIFANPQRSRVVTASSCRACALCFKLLQLLTEEWIYQGWEKWALALPLTISSCSLGSLHSQLLPTSSTGEKPQHQMMIFCNFVALMSPTTLDSASEGAVWVLIAH